MKKIKTFLFLSLVLANVEKVLGQTKTSTEELISKPGILIMIVLLVIPLMVGVLILVLKLSKVTDKMAEDHELEEEKKFAKYLQNLEGEDIENVLELRKKALDYKLTNTELSGFKEPYDEKGLIVNRDEEVHLGLIAHKKKAIKRPTLDPEVSQLILWYIITATFWLLFGTTVGEYLGIKFVAPDVDHQSWLSFGRLRPVHTNAVFWGWSSLAMLGMGYYVVPMVSNTKIASIDKGWQSLYLVNLAIVLGSICLMCGVNNGGGEYREYIWPVMLLFGLGLTITLLNFIQTIAKRSMKEVYISNWYIVSALIFTLIITVVAYLPFWQNGLGETIVQGYYMHQGVGMWFMLFNLGLVYYFLPQQLNKPIYSYGLGIMAFWAQIFFYTVIGTHHFVFSAIPWWLQTVAIVGSVGMLIPVFAGTTNFFYTFKGSWHKIKNSYTLPFYLVGIVFYFTGSMQGTAEAFRYTNLVWHFTDFTTAHSHITMYGIITFLLWGSIYAVVPRITQKEPSHTTVGLHFWMAFIGLLFYTIPLMIGGTLKGLLWMESKPFIESVIMMKPYWLWRAIGGSMMWFSHVVFAVNLYKMIHGKQQKDLKKTGIALYKSSKEKNTINSEI
jgi:cytochrome c oxidase cbb3-type subunit I